MTEPTSNIELQNVSKIYKSGETQFKAVDDVSFEIKRGEFVTNR